ncbi:ANTAR domain-containing protein [Streptomyces sp. NBC_00237]|uniref:GAF and ANTAR domain-containing protein n=1 Tax=Streptomyces sp. NBC_00237 TaxID=2975687 RepID=UPI002255DBE3|nr:GAF and ANTAR domain-containing protein [Streptomyces sp. NBC_00237]MCX5200987.1 ANTAR domain-containing protein [Streptomyces sp. NBC_00237]
MVSTRMTALLAELAVRRTAGLDEPFARRCADVLGVDGLSVSLSVGPASPDGAPGEPVWFSGATGAALEDLQFTVGQGPALDVQATGALVLDGDLDQVPWERWPAFLPAAADLGVRAVFALPLQIGAIRLGVLTLYRAAPGGLSEQELRDALVFRDTLTLALLGAGDGLAGDGLAGDGHTGDGNTRDGNAGDGHAGDVHTGGEPPDPPSGRSPAQDFTDYTLYRAEVHQATGMIAARLKVAPSAALVRLRAYAYSSDVPILEAARDVLARRLIFTPEGASRDGDGLGKAR